MKSSIKKSENCNILSNKELGVNTLYEIISPSNYEGCIVFIPFGSVYLVQLHNQHSEISVWSNYKQLYDFEFKKFEETITLSN